MTSKGSGTPGGSNRPPNRTPQRTAAGHFEAPTLTVWIYDSTMGAAAGEVRLKDLKERNVLQVRDAVTVMWMWMPRSHRPRIGHLRQTSEGATRSSILGGLVGLTILEPADEAGDAGIVALAQRLLGIGIDLILLQSIKAQLGPQTSAQLVLSGHADPDEVRPVIERALARGDVALMHAQPPHGGLEILPEAVHGLQKP